MTVINDEPEKQCLIIFRDNVVNSLHDFVSISFPEYSGRKIMIINVSRSAEPVTIPANNKSMLFVRGDGLSKELGVDETRAYCKRRFEK